MSGKLVLSDKQQYVFDSIMAFLLNDKKAIYVFSGVAGSGKSSIIKVLMDWLELTGKRCRVMTLTGRASASLREKGVRDSGTIHSTLYEPVMLEGKLAYFQARSPAEIRDIYDCFIVDEAGMVNEEMFETIMAAGLPTLFVGDKEQLPPIGDKAFNIMDAYDYHLDEIHRQAEGSEIIQLSKSIRETGTWGSGYTNGQVRFIKKSQVNKAFLSAEKPDIIICGTHRTRRSMNALSRAAYGYTDNLPMAGERLMCLMNKPNAQTQHPYFNGEIYEVDSVDRFAVFDTTSNGYATYNLRGTLNIVPTPIQDATILAEESPDRNSPYQDFTYGYASTAHKCQGSQFRKVLVIDEDVSYFLPQKAYRYTAITRAVEEVIVAI